MVVGAGFPADPGQWTPLNLLQNLGQTLRAVVACPVSDPEKAKVRITILGAGLCADQ